MSADRLARDVATELDRRRRRRRLATLTGLAALVAAAALYLRCGAGWGLGGSSSGGPGATSRGEPARPEPRQRCSIKVTATGLVVDGKPATRDAAVATCTTAGGAMVIVAGDAREGDWTELEQALEAAHVPIDRRGP